MTEKHGGKGRIVTLSSLLVGLILVLGYFYIEGRRNQIETDPETLCPISEPPSQVVVLLLDMSDGFSEPQRLKIRNELERIENSLPRFALVEVYVVDQLNRRVTKPVLRLCNPGQGTNLSRIYQNPELVQRRWAEFIKKLNAQVEFLMTAPKSDVSPIFEAIQSVALRTLNRPSYKGIPKNLIVVSDLLQNVPGKMTHYSSTPSFRDFVNKDYFSEIRCDLTGVDVTLLYLVRPRTPQKWPDHFKFWEQYFLVQGATVDLVEPVYGAE